MAAVAREMPRRSWREMPWQAIGIATLFVCFGTAAYLEFARKSTHAIGDVRAVLSPLPKKNELGPVPTDDPETAFAKTVNSETPDSAGSTSLPNVSGRRSTPTIRNVYSPNERSSVLFEFTQDGSMLQGRVIETNEGEIDGVGATIIEGRIVNNVISFYTKGEYSGSNDNAVPYKRRCIPGSLRMADGRSPFNDWTTYQAAVKWKSLSQSRNNDHLRTVRRRSIGGYCG